MGSSRGPSCARGGGGMLSPGHKVERRERREPQRPWDHRDEDGVGASEGRDPAPPPPQLEGVGPSSAGRRGRPDGGAAFCPQGRPAAELRSLVRLLSFSAPQPGAASGASPGARTLPRAWGRVPRRDQGPLGGCRARPDAREGEGPSGRLPTVPSWAGNWIWGGRAVLWGRRGGGGRGDGGVAGPQS